MASSGLLQSEDYYLCSICLEVFNEPVSIACGHNFCKACISKYWDGTNLCQCPLCKRTFPVRPDLNVNTLISELAAQFKLSVTVRDVASRPHQQASRPGKVSCDVCPVEKLTAFKSCLECLTSYCETHLEPHHLAPALMRHKLIDPVENLEDRVCKQHNRPLELFCRTDRVCVCEFCAMLSHKTHHTVSLHEEYEARKPLLEKTATDVRQMIQIKTQKIQEIQDGVQLSKEEAEREIEDSKQAVGALVTSILTFQAELVRTIEGHQKALEGEALECITELLLEVGDLQTTFTQLQLLTHVDDHLLFLQRFPAQSVLPRTVNWSDFNVCAHPKTKGTKKVLWKYIHVLEFTLSTLSSKIQELSDMKCLKYAEVKRMQRFEVDVLLDRDTANPWLIVSPNRKQVRFSESMQRVTMNPKRFTNNFAVLGQDGFSAGKFHFEVQVKGKVEWAVGMASESICRGGSIDLSPENGLWAIFFKDGRYKVYPDIPLNHSKVVHTMGVFVDCEVGKVLFYDVENRYHLFSFTDITFEEEIYPYLNPCDNEDGPNSASLIICPLHNDERNQSD